MHAQQQNIQPCCLLRCSIGIHDRWQAMQAGNQVPYCAPSLMATACPVGMAHWLSWLLGRHLHHVAAQTETVACCNRCGLNKPRDWQPKRPMPACTTHCRPHQVTSRATSTDTDHALQDIEAAQHCYQCHRFDACSAPALIRSSVQSLAALQRRHRPRNTRHMRQHTNLNLNTIGRVGS